MILHKGYTPYPDILGILLGVTFVLHCLTRTGADQRPLAPPQRYDREQPHCPGVAGKAVPGDMAGDDGLTGEVRGACQDFIYPAASLSHASSSAPRPPHTECPSRRARWPAPTDGRDPTRGAGVSPVNRVHLI